MNLLFEVVSDVAKLGLFVAFAHLALNAWSRRKRPQWTEALTRRRFAVLGILTLVVSAIKVIEDVLARESGVVDEAVLWFVRDHVPAALGGFFSAVTQSGSALGHGRALAVRCLGGHVPGRFHSAIDQRRLRLAALQTGLGGQDGRMNRSVMQSDVGRIGNR